MSPFLIYGIVLTIALILYYITLIMMDLNVKNKKENKNELTINSGDDTEDEDEEYAPQSVVETSSGGFDFVNASEEPNETEEIQEATEEVAYEEKSTNSHEKGVETSDESKESELEEDKMEHPEENEVDNNQPETVQEDKEQIIEGEKDENSSIEETAQEEAQDKENSEDKENEKSATEEEISEEEDFGIQSESFGTCLETDTPQKDLSNSELFDEKLRTTKYGVNQTYGPKVSKAVENSIDTINNSLEQIERVQKGIMNPAEMMKMMKDNKENSNIETHDQITRY